MKSIDNKIFIGYDSREIDAFNACMNSIISNTDSCPFICELNQNKLRKNGHYYREVDILSSTEFSFTRFLIPHLTEYKGWSVFCDCDFIFLEDIQELFDLCDDQYAVMVCKHDYIPTNNIKMDGKVQHQYPRKNWSSLVLWNNAHPKNKLLTKDMVNTQTGQFLHRFSWLDDKEIGEIPIQWNWLVGWYKEPKDGKPKALHFTEGGPWFKEYENCEYCDVYDIYKLT
jgi:lipopolysaccharide biosynthesis glycosyltransferase